ncbi:MAG: class II glutamine amidotransferase, partial [Myxococcota bacterium]
MAASPAMRLKALPRAVYHHLQPFGWGIAWYPSGDQAAVVIKDPTTLENSAMTQLLKDWKRFRSSIFLAHIRGAAKRRTQQDTHPFSQSYARRTWLMAHNGDLAQDLRERLPIGEEPEFEPIGRTDSEHAFCWLMGHVSRSGARTLDEVGWDTLHGWLRQINALGTANLLLTDGVNLVGYHDQDGFGRLHWARMTPPHTHQHFENEALSLALDDPMDQNLTLSIFSAQPMSNSEWTQLQPGQMVVLRRGALRWSSLPEPPQRTTPPPEDNDALRTPAADPAHTPPIHLSGRPTPAGIVPTIGALQRPPAHPIEVATPQPAEGRSERSNRHQVEPPQPLRPRILRITHETIYRYREPVEESTHLLRLRPVHDFQQQLVDYALHIDPMGIQSDFEDVFGNWISRLDVEIDYDVMSVRSHSLVKLQVNTRLTHSFSNYH